VSVGDDAAAPAVLKVWAMDKTDRETNGFLCVLSKGFFFLALCCSYIFFWHTDLPLYFFISCFWARWGKVCLSLCCNCIFFQTNLYAASMYCTISYAKYTNLPLFFSFFFWVKICSKPCRSLARVWHVSLQLRTCRYFFFHPFFSCRLCSSVYIHRLAVHNMCVCVRACVRVCVRACVYVYCCRLCSWVYIQAQSSLCMVRAPNLTQTYPNLI
jgi:hypothetical protein